MSARSPYAPRRRNNVATVTLSSVLRNGEDRSRRRKRLSVLVLCLLLRYRRSDPVVRAASFVLHRTPLGRFLLFLRDGLRQHLVPSFDEDETRRRRETISSVLDYWFAASPDESQRGLWMVSASSNTERIRSVDRDVTERFGALLLRVANDDAYRDALASHGWEGGLAVVLVLDQLARHERRYRRNAYRGVAGTTKDDDDDPRLAPARLDALALATARGFATRHRAAIAAGRVPTPCCVFALMPLRHANTMANSARVLEAVRELTDLQRQTDRTLDRFRRATTRRLHGLQDAARRAGGETTDATTKFADEDILEAFSFEADASTAKDHPTLRAVRDFLADRGVRPTTDDGDGDDTPLIVSLSGGVDSMVIAAVLVHLRAHLGYSRLRVLAAHVDYANRPESRAEADFVERWCRDRGVDFRRVRVDHVTRGVAPRDEYERESRRVRHDLYARVAVSVGRPDGVPVLLGHHRGDLRENVLSNALKGRGPLELSGMTPTSVSEGVETWRPLLTLEKDDVLDYARAYGVPWLKDTTPRWSTRGRLRGSVLPLLRDVYGDGAVRNLAGLATESDAARELLTDTALRPFFEAVVTTPMGVVLPTAPFRDRGLFFWRFVLKDALHKAGRGMFSDKAVAAFVERVRQLDDKDPTKVKGGWLQCRKDYAVFLQKDGRVYVLHPDSFPWDKKDRYDVDELHVGVDSTTRVGPWRVSLETIQDADRERTNESLARKALVDMDHLMTGSFEYRLACPDDDDDDNDGSPLVVLRDGFARGARPPAWKGVDTKIESVLPLVGLRARPSSSSSRRRRIVRVRYLRDGAEEKHETETTKKTTKENARYHEHVALKEKVREMNDSGRANDFWQELMMPFKSPPPPPSPKSTASSSSSSSAAGRTR